jgi:hypothetical protein
LTLSFGFPSVAAIVARRRAPASLTADYKDFQKKDFVVGYWLFVKKYKQPITNNQQH